MKEGIVMSNHIEAKIGEVADVVLLPGDPLRAKYIAEKISRKSCLLQSYSQYVWLYWNI